jgi:hypothetical protein
VKWRTGSEGRISYLKRRYGFDRTLLDGLPGVQTCWCGLGVLAHNTVKIAHLRSTGVSSTTQGNPARLLRGEVVRPGYAWSAMSRRISSRSYSARPGLP